MNKEQVLELLFFIDEESRKVSSEYGLPLYEREAELLVYKVQEKLQALKDK